MYVVKSDYKTIISTVLLETIIKETEADTGEDILNTVSRVAEDTITTKAGVLYEVGSELLKAGLARNYMILSLAMAIAAYWLYQRIDDEEIPAKVVKNYNDAMNTLDEISLGKTPLRLPPKQSDGESGGGDGEQVVTDGTGLRRMGSQPKRTHQV